MVCLNPRLRAERGRKREALLKATEAALEEIANIVRQPRSKLRGRDRINRRVGREANRRKVEKHFQITVSDDKLEWARDEGKIAAEALLDGIYIVRTSLPAEAISPDEAVLAYKSLSRVERAFRCLKQSRLQVRPIYVQRRPCSRSCLPVHACLLPRMAPAQATRATVVRGRRPRGRNCPTQDTRAKGRRIRTGKAEGRNQDHRNRPAAHSLRTMLQDLGNLTCNEATLPGQPNHPFTIIAKPTPLQAEAFQRLGVEPSKMIPVPLHP